MSKTLHVHDTGAFCVYNSTEQTLVTAFAQVGQNQRNQMRYGHAFKNGIRMRDHS